MTEMECPVCFDTLKPPIMSCSDGHSVCGTCQKSIKNCPLCRKELVCRNRTLENVLATIPLSCRNKGCQEKKTHDELPVHEKLCFYRKVKCFSLNCPNGDNISFHEFAQHLFDHNFTCPMDSGVARQFLVTRNPKTISCVWFVGLNVNPKQYFLYHVILYKDKKEMNVDVRYMGPSEDADKYMFTVSIEQGMGADMLTYTNYTMPYYTVFHEPCSIPNRRLHITDYRTIFHSDSAIGDKMKTQLVLFPAHKPPSSPDWSVAS